MSLTGLDVMSRALKDIAVPLFCTACNECPTDRLCKLDKLRNLWTANQYFDEGVVGQLNDPLQSAANYRARLIAENQDVSVVRLYKCRIAATFTYFLGISTLYDDYRL